MSGDEGGRTNCGGEGVNEERIGREKRLNPASPKQPAAPSRDALQGCALQHPYACEANRVPGATQGTMRTQVSENAHTTDNRWRIYEQAKSMLGRHALDNTTYEACIALVTRELGL